MISEPAPFFFPALSVVLAQVPGFLARNFTLSRQELELPVAPRKFGFGSPPSFPPPPVVFFLSPSPRSGTFVQEVFRRAPSPCVYVSRFGDLDGHTPKRQLAPS